MMRIRDIILVAVGTTLADLFFHAFFTSPQEVPLYFVAKFLLATVTAYVLVNSSRFSVKSVFERGIVGGVIFDVLVGLYYAVAYYTSSPVLSCCYVNAPVVNGVPQATYFMLGYYPITGNVLAFIGVHFFVFFLAYQIVYRYL